MKKAYSYMIWLKCNRKPLNQISNFKELKCEKSLNINK